jgi:adenosine deaminase
MTLDDLRASLYEVHSEQATEGSSYVELRFSPRRFLVSGYSWQEVIGTVSNTVMAMREPEFRIILLLNRDSPESFVAETEAIIESGLPTTFVGLDLAGDEVRFPDVGRFKQCFSTAKKSGLCLTAHAGEFGSEASIWMALDELGAKRIGHGLASVRSHSLLRRLSTDEILMEVSVTSNLATGAIPEIGLHPLPKLLHSGIPVSLNTDVPVYTGATLQDEHRLAGSLLTEIPGWAELVDDASIKHAFRKGCGLA